MGCGADLLDPNGEAILVPDQSERGPEQILARALALATELCRRSLWIALLRASRYLRRHRQELIPRMNWDR
jgi:hypothetical protein